MNKLKTDYPLQFCYKTLACVLFFPHYLSISVKNTVPMVHTLSSAQNLRTFEDLY